MACSLINELIDERFANNVDPEQLAAAAHTLWELSVMWRVRVPEESEEESRRSRDHHRRGEAAGAGGDAVPDDTPLCSVEAYRAMQPVYAKFGRLLAIIRNNIPEDQADDLRRFWKAKGSPPRKEAGTGAYDTPEETWRRCARRRSRARACAASASASACSTPPSCGGGAGPTRASYGAVASSSIRRT